jgi:hypothetical protein
VWYTGRVCQVQLLPLLIPAVRGLNFHVQHATRGVDK